jgi:hypothetical protein
LGAGGSDDGGEGYDDEDGCSDFGCSNSRIALVVLVVLLGVGSDDTSHCGSNVGVCGSNVENSGSGVGSNGGCVSGSGFGGNYDGDGGMVVVIVLLTVILMVGLEVVLVKVMVVTVVMIIRVVMVFWGAADELAGGSDVGSGRTLGF